MKKITKLNPKSDEIIKLLYRFRFLTREQIQKILGHKHHSRILLWLNELVDLKYVAKFYEKSFVSEPAVYCLDYDGRKYLKKTGNLSLEPLSRVWKEKNYSLQFRHHCLFIADIYIYLSKKHKNLKFRTKTDLYGVENMISPLADIYFALDDKNERYFIDIFDDIPSVALRTRAKEYIRYYESDDWQYNTDKPFPEIILICHSQKMKSHLFYFIRNKLRENEEPVFWLGLKNDVANKGLSKDTLQKVIYEY